MFLCQFKQFLKFLHLLQIHNVIFLEINETLSHVTTRTHQIDGMILLINNLRDDTESLENEVADLISRSTIHEIDAVDLRNKSEIADAAINDMQNQYHQLRSSNNQLQYQVAQLEERMFNLRLISISIQNQTSVFSKNLTTNQQIIRSLEDATRKNEDLANQLVPRE